MVYVATQHNLQHPHATTPLIRLNNDVDTPRLGPGTARVTDEETRRIVRGALELGYRFVDTAASCGNEVGVCQGIAGRCMWAGNARLWAHMQKAQVV